MNFTSVLETVMVMITIKVSTCKNLAPFSEINKLNEYVSLRFILQLSDYCWWYQLL